jgi:hypothetical protein
VVPVEFGIRVCALSIFRSQHVYDVTNLSSGLHHNTVVELDLRILRVRCGAEGS